MNHFCKHFFPNLSPKVKTAARNLDISDTKNGSAISLISQSTETNHTFPNYQSVFKAPYH